MEQNMQLVNLPPLVLKVRHLCGSAFLLKLGMLEQAVGWLPLIGLGLVVEAELS
jgi:hypothetical protein